MTTRDGRKWLVLRSWPGRPYVAARADSEFAQKYRKTGTVAGSFRTMQAALDRAKELNRPWAGF